MQSSSKCRSCGLDLGRYVETHCPQCGVNLAPKTASTAVIWLLNVMIGTCGTLFVLASTLLLALYLNSSSQANLYKGEAYHATTFRVTSVYYTRRVTTTGDQLSSVDIAAYGIGIVEGKREAMDLYPYLRTMPLNQQQLEAWVPEGTVIPVYIFPTLRGQNRVQIIGPVPTAEAYERQATWASSRWLSAVGMLGAIMAPLILARSFLSRKRREADGQLLKYRHLTH